MRAHRRPPEILDSGATIARRTIQMDDPFQNMGGMLIRHLAWRVFERAGDGTATAVVLAQALLHHTAAFRAAAQWLNKYHAGRSAHQYRSRQPL